MVWGLGVWSSNPPAQTNNFKDLATRGFEPVSDITLMDERSRTGRLFPSDQRTLLTRAHGRWRCGV